MEADKDAQAKTEEGLPKLTGKVMLNEKCPFFIETFENGQMVRMYPVNLADEFKKHGSKIRFTYIPSRAMQPNECMVEKVVVVDNVELLK
jgi:hypothetical protein